MLSHQSIVVILLVSIIIGGFMGFAGYQYGVVLHQETINEVTQKAAEYKDQVETLNQEKKSLEEDVVNTQEALRQQEIFVNAFGSINTIPQNFSRYISDNGVTFVYPQSIVQEVEGQESIREFVIVHETDKGEGATEILLKAKNEDAQLEYVVALERLNDVPDVQTYIMTLVRQRFGEDATCTLETNQKPSGVVLYKVIEGAQESGKCNVVGLPTAYVYNETRQLLARVVMDNSPVFSSAQQATFLNSITILP